MFELKVFLFFLTIVSFSVENANLKDCETKEIRSYQDLNSLNNCTAILGNLALLFPLLEEPTYTPDEINNLSFPLREVTGFLLIYSVTHLNSLGGFFPNLTIIRGQRLFYNYAFVVYDTDLEEITLRSLLKINRGSVKIGGENQNLCLPKIDWDRIIVNGKLYVGNVISKPQACLWQEFDKCGSCNEPFKCWSSQACQRFEHSYLPYKRQKTKAICHPLCLGDCVNSSASGCFTCKDISEDLKCVEKCSESRYLNTDTRRCISKEECLKHQRSIYEEFCVENCPSGYSTTVSTGDDIKSSNGTECLKCKAKCPKFCQPPEIRRVSQLEKLGTGCSIIDGDLEINIAEDVSNLTVELKTYLGDIEEIWGVLKIHRSPPLTELTFLNRLRVIQGRENRASILIFENQNLQTLFDWRVRGKNKLKMKSGYIQIYNNMLLCPSEIKMTSDNIERSKSSSDLFQNNSSKNKCSNNTIETSHYVWSHNSCAIRIPNKLSKFKAHIIQFVSISSSQKPDEEMLFERDSCSSYGWQQFYVNFGDWKIKSDGQLEFNLTGLTQFTNYAYTVQTYQYGETSLYQNNDNEGAISAVKIFRTDLLAPSRVKNLKVIKKTPSSIQLQWEVLENEVDAIKHFLVDIITKPFSTAAIDQRNFCANPIDISEYQLIEVYDEEETVDVTKDLTCCEQCCKFDKDRKEIRKKTNNDFEEALINFSDEVSRNSWEPSFKIKMLPDFLDRLEIEPQRRNYTIKELNSTTPYLFYVHACSNSLKCSTYSLVSETTDRNSSDTYDKVHIKPMSLVFEIDHFHVYFDEPKVKNGVILNYITEISQIVDNITQFFFSDCITRKQHEKNRFKYSLENLMVGQYVFRVRAVSLGGNGPFTDFHAFSIISTDKSILDGWYLLAAVLIVLVVCVSSVSYYYKYKILLTRKNYNDKIHLMDEIEPTDFYEVSLRHSSDESAHCKSLEDIMEFDEC